ncbi:UNVERIFIED_CONTAM: FAD-dependent oxidoreductase [Campylobacter lari]
MNKYDVVIIGAGPAGLNCSLYTSRAGLSTLIIEKNMPGGKINFTDTVENYLGFEKVEGYQLAEDLYKHAMKFGSVYKQGEVKQIKNIKPYENEVILTNGDIIEAKIVVIASGMINRHPENVTNFEKFLQKGISFCGVCDGPLFRNKDIIVYGGGNSAVEEALFLSQYANSVKLILRSEDFIADEISVQKVYENPKIVVYKHHSLEALHGENFLQKVHLKNLKNNETVVFEAEGLFPMIGFVPPKDFYKDLPIYNEKGFILTDENMETKVKSIYAIGDIREKNIRQIITAASDGSIAAKEI